MSEYVALREEGVDRNCSAISRQPSRAWIEIMIMRASTCSNKSPSSQKVLPKYKVPLPILWLFPCLSPAL